MKILIEIRQQLSQMHQINVIFRFENCFVIDVRHSEITQNDSSSQVPTFLMHFGFFCSCDAQFPPIIILYSSIPAAGIQHKRTIEFIHSSWRYEVKQNKKCLVGPSETNSKDLCLSVWCIKSF